MNKETHYEQVLSQVQSLCEGETDLIAKMANVSALLHQEFGFWWTGFYRVMPVATPSDLQPQTTELVLGPFQGPLACVHIGYGRGVCGTAWKEERTIVVPDVEQFPGHIACSTESRSEIVVPLRDDNRVVAVLDIDSRELASFDEVDAHWLELVAEYMMQK